MVAYIVSSLENAFYRLVSEIRSNTQTIGNISSCPEMYSEVILLYSIRSTHWSALIQLSFLQYWRVEWTHLVVFQAALALLFVWFACGAS